MKPVTAPLAATLGLLAAALFMLVAIPAGAQQGVAFGGLAGDSTLPVSIQSDRLTIDNGEGTAVFAGDVVATQGDLHLAAAEVHVAYAADQRTITRIHATGGVTLASPSEAAEAQEALYSVTDGRIVMTGDVLVTQGTSAIAGERLVLDLATGRGVMEGRVSTTLVPGEKR